MSAREITVTISDLTPLELTELRNALAAAGCVVESTLKASKMPSDVSGSRKGEPFTMLAVLTVGQLAVAGLAIYLAKGRSRIRKTETIVFQDAQGRKFEYKLALEADKEEAIKADLMREVAQFKMSEATGHINQ